MPQPVETIEFIANRSALAGGTEAETDDVLRERAKKGLRALGRATYNSLKQRIEEIEGVVRPIRIDEMPVLYNVEVGGSAVGLPVPGLVRVIVDGGDMAKIKEAVDDTRAAGVFVEILRPRPVLLDFQVALELQEGTALSDVEPAIREGIERYLGSVTIGETVIFGRLTSVVLAAPGVRDVRGISVDAYRDGQLSAPGAKENIVLGQDEKARVRNVSVQVSGAK
jgi:uncharacterized phage protein gp47/JayE